MSKAILIIDAPEICLDCPCCNNLVCTATGNVVLNKIDRPDWCPLRPMPSTLVDVVLAPDSTYDAVSYMTGWNNCIDAILGGTRTGDT